jgi:hypothetical protein
MTQVAISRLFAYGTKNYASSTCQSSEHETGEYQMIVTQPTPAPVFTGQTPPTPRDHLLSPVTHAVLRVQNAINMASREYLAAHGYMELLPPVIGPVTDPGCRGAKQVDVDYYGHKYKLMTSVILYKQASLLAFDKIFYLAPNVRLEPLETATTGRHLVEFHQPDVEAAGASREEILDLCQGLLRYVVSHVVRESAAELAVLHIGLPEGDAGVHRRRIPRGARHPAQLRSHRPGWIRRAVQRRRAHA